MSSTWEEAKKGLSLRMIARNDTGNVLHARSVARYKVPNLVVVEIDAVRVALLVVQQNGWRRIEV